MDYFREIFGAFVIFCIPQLLRSKKLLIGFAVIFFSSSIYLYRDYLANQFEMDTGPGGGLGYAIGVIFFYLITGGIFARGIDIFLEQKKTKLYIRRIILLICFIISCVMVVRT